MQDPHFVERGFPTEVEHEEIGGPVMYPGPPIRFTASPMAIRHPAPRLGEHTDEVVEELRARR
jgi:crotonobetainyl-CoA:carnitine CoA-transferase CaiB-like acyl-CoA transferase